jgi:hypothetical protein
MDWSGTGLRLLRHRYRRRKTILPWTEEIRKHSITTRIFQYQFMVNHLEAKDQNGLWDSCLQLAASSRPSRAR